MNLKGNDVMPGIRLDAVTIDCPDSKALVAFYHRLSGMRIVKVDPAGHPFCIATPFTDSAEGLEPHPQVTDAFGKPTITVAAISFDCPDNQALASFYAALNDMTPIDVGDSDHSALLSDKGYLMTFQRVEKYQAPT